MNYINYKVKCPICKRKILVEMGLFGVLHHTGIITICGECIGTKTNGSNWEKFKKDWPKEAGSIVEWLNHEDEK